MDPIHHFLTAVGSLHITEHLQTNDGFLLYELAITNSMLLHVFIMTAAHLRTYLVGFPTLGPFTLTMSFL